MSGASLIPTDAPNDHEDVADLLSIARVTWNRGDHAAAVSFVQRAAQAAIELELEMRGLELAKAAAEIRATLSVMPAPPVRASNGPQSPTMTPPLVLTPHAPPHGPPPSEEPETIRRDVSHMPAPSPAAIPKPPGTDPGLGFLTAADEVDVDAPQQRTSTGAPTANMLTPQLKVSAAPPRVTPSVAPRPTAATPPPSPAASTMARPSGPPPAPPVRTSAAPRASVVPANGSPAPPRVTASPAPPRTTTARPSGVPPPAGAMPSRAPLPLRVQPPQPSMRPVMPGTPAPPAVQPQAQSPAPPPAAAAPVVAAAPVPAPAVAPHELPAPPRGMIAPAVDPTPSMRKSAPWIDEVVGPIVSEGGAPVVVGVRARVHFRTDGSLEIGPDVESAGGLPVIVLPQRGEDMTTLLKRLKR